ncbi:CaiB/BaiF CoA transferase family protein [Aquabacter spiritensis]|uniref:Crotonobetainyl-CoA:carnitine CoA-transferase CaiB-like acyl-CoA transferase n=1 Tax=Aquabacter spiritensis TaxID=933073 RepID=A0A4R3LX85_9HYPH|nr:CoA transferase [Aquabacter spiritensis]TCT05193.1 crotonobetainyl-CoA:carnitine CoA-transferase CaiB-like acyl-CoA transferase [Aquabacter spiritensis]
MTMRPLEGIRILDLTRVFSGPWATQMLGDLGAEVIKVEQPRRGDDLRKLGPPFLKDADGAETKESAYYLSVNRNKKSITVDIASAEGQAIVRDLADRSDVVMENFKVGDLARYGLDHASLSARNPRLIYCSITAFGQTGPNRHRMGYDTLLQAMCGVMSVTGHPDGAPGGGPIKVGFVLSDLIAGSYAATAVVSALFARDARGGTGQHIDISMFDAQVAAMSHQGMHYLVSGEDPQRFGTGAPSVVPSQVFACSDGHIVLVAGNDAQFRKLAALVGLPELGTDPLYATNGARVRNRARLIPQLEAKFVARTKQAWLDDLEANGLVAGPINAVSDVFADPHVAARGLVVAATHASGGTVPLIASPMRLSGTPLDVYAAPPVQGQHTHEILSGLLGMGAAEIAALEDKKIIVD